GLHHSVGAGSAGFGASRHISAARLHIEKEFEILEVSMNSNEIRGKFNELKGDFKMKWGELTDDDWTQISGSKDKLLGVLQQKYGRTKEQAQREIDDFWNENQERKVS